MCLLIDLEIIIVHGSNVSCVLQALEKNIRTFFQVYLRLV